MSCTNTINTEKNLITKRGLCVIMKVLRLMSY